MFGFGRDDDFVEEIIEEIIEEQILLDMLDCGRCRRGTRCRCSGRDAMGMLIEAAIIEEIIDDIF